MHLRRFNVGLLGRMLIKAAAITLVNALIALWLNNHTTRFMGDESHVSDHLIDVFVAFTLMSAIVGTHADGKFNKAQSALRRGDKEGYFDYAMARTGITLKVCTLLTGVSVLYIMHMQHYEDPIALMNSNIVMGMIVCTVLLSLDDLDDPTRGIVYLPVRAEWSDELQELQCNGKNRCPVPATLLHSTNDSN